MLADPPPAPPEPAPEAEPDLVVTAMAQPRASSDAIARVLADYRPPPSYTVVRPGRGSL